MKLILSAILVMLLSTAAYAESLEVVSISRNFQHAQLKDTFSGQSVSAGLGDMVSNCRVEGITQNFVTVSKLQKGTVFLVRLPVKEHPGKKKSATFSRTGED